VSEKRFWLALLLLVILTVMVTSQPVSASSTLIVTPSTPLPNQDFTISGQFTGIGSGVTLWVYIYVGSGCQGSYSTIQFAKTSGSPPGSWSMTFSLNAGSWSAQASDFNDASACVPFTVTTPVGGVVTIANTFALVSPWLALVGLVGCIGTVVVVAKKR
jgi:hypothetical protein